MNDNILTVTLKVAKERNVDIYLMSNCSVFHPGIRVQMSDARYKVVKIIDERDLFIIDQEKMDLLLNGMADELQRLCDEEDDPKTIVDYQSSADFEKEYAKTKEAWVDRKEK